MEFVIYDIGLRMILQFSNSTRRYHNYSLIKFRKSSCPWICNYAFQNYIQ